MLRVTDLRCEHLANPLGIDIRRPRLSWRIESNQRGAHQSAYRITAAAAEGDLSAGQNLLWDSGRVESGRSVLAPFEGPALRSRQRVHWRVQIWDEQGREATSDPAWWEMGLLRRAEWRGRWIGAELAGGRWTASPAPFLRRSFTIDRPIASARLYVTALGVYSCRINGEAVGEDVFAPGWTDYATRVQYQVYDVAELLWDGENVIGAILGDGWYCGHVAWQGRQSYGDRPQLLAQLEIRFADGSERRVVSDGAWRRMYGPILASDMLMGESYDARLEQPGWDAPGFSDAGWAAATLFPAPEAELCAMRGPAVRRQELLRPIADPAERRTSRDSHWTFDFGQVMTGYVRLTVSGPAGATVTIRHAEALNPDGTIYTTNLRSALQTDHYTLRGDGVETYEPHFTFHGFRYVELRGFPGRPTIDSVAGVVLHSDTAPTGEFSCSDPLINQLQHNIVWGQKGNFVDVPTDCPQRDERLGWTGDAQVFIRTATFNMDVSAFFTRWLRDLADAQREDGAIPAVIPHIAQSQSDGGPAWADAAIICPWTIWRRYGDLRLLEELYPTMERFMGYLERTSRDLIRLHPDVAGQHCYGDWLALDDSSIRQGRTPHDLIGTAFYANNARLMVEIANAIGRPQDARRFARLFERVRQAFLRRFVTGDGLIVGQTQTGYVLALAFGLLPEELRPQAAAELARDINRRGTHLSTGFVGTPYLLHVLTAAGRLDLAYDLLMQRSWPSWLYPVTQGATTIWERWDGWTEQRGFQDPGMNSFNHYAYGAVGDWLYATVAGLDVAPDSAGYQRLLLRPRPGGGLTSARARYQTPYGEALSDWRIEEEQFIWDIIVPPNADAEVFVPCARGAQILEGAAPAEESPGVSALGWADGAAHFSVGAGRYQFRV